MAGLRFFLGGKPSGGEMENRQHDRWSEPRNHYDDGRDMRQHYGRPSSPMENRFDQPDYRPMRGLYNLEPQRSDQPEPHMRGLYNYKHPDGMNHYDPQRHGGAQGNFVPLPEDDVRFHEEWNNEGGNRIGYISDVRNHDGSHSDGGHFERGVASVMESLPAVGGYAKIVESVLKVLQNPPATWAAYLKNKDYAGIAKMEAKELMSAIEKHKAPADIHKEITHTIAALMRMGMYGTCKGANMAAGTSIFLPVMEYNGDTWHLQYDPENPMSVRPDLVGGKITNMSCAPVKLPRQHPDKQFYMVVVSILMPASMEPSGRAIPEKRLLGFRVYDYLPANPSTLDALNLNEMVFYIAEPRPGSDAQTLLETVLGLKMQEQPAAEAVNTDWTKMLMQQDAPEPQPEPVAPQQRAYTAPQQHTMQLSDGTVR